MAGAGSTVKTLNDKLTSLISQLTSLTTTITLSFNDLTKGGSLKSQDLTMTREIREFKDKAATYDREFEEEEARLQRYGGKSRKQTLQEFVLLFFFVSYGILTIAVTIHANRTGVPGMPQKTFGLMLFILLIITAMIIKYS